MKPTITVHHVREPLDPAKINLYCGRGNAPAGMVNARMGNPFVMKDQSEAERDRVCDNYAAWLFGQGPDDYARKAIHRLAEHVRDGRQVALYCYCAPKRCHTESIVKYVLEHTCKNNKETQTIPDENIPKNRNCP